MKTREDFQNMFEPADAGFEDAVQRTLWQIRRQEGNVVRKKLSIGLVVAVLLSLLLAAAALAAAVRWGVLDFVTKRTAGETQVLPEATALVQSADAIPQTGGHLKDADFSVRQAVYDGSQAYVVVEVRPKQVDVMLTDDWDGPGGRIGNLIQEYRGSDTTTEEYAKAVGKTRFFSTSVGTGGAANWFADSQDVLMEEDGTLTFMLKGECKEQVPELEVALSCYAAPYKRNGDGGWQTDEALAERGTLSFTLKLSDSILDRAIYSEPLEFPGAGVRVDRVTLECKPMAVYYEINYTVTDLKAYKATQEGLFFEFLGEDGRRIEDGAASSYAAQAGGGDGFGSEPVLSEGSAFIQKGSLTAIKALPESVTLLAFNCWEKNRYEAHEIRLK